MNSKTLRLDNQLIKLAEKQTKITKRSASKQIEFWAELGMRAEKKLTTKDVEEIFQDKVELLVKLKNVQGIDTNSVFKNLEKDRSENTLTSKVVTSKEWYDVSRDHPGYLVRTNKKGEKKIGKFEKGKFKIYFDT
jgi:hypothetical protein